MDNLTEKTTFGKVTVVNIKDSIGNKWYIGRGTPLGNPFIINKNRNEIEERKRVIKSCKIHLINVCRNIHSSEYKELEKIFVRLSMGIDVNLSCHCKPKDCHGDFIKEILDSWVNATIALKNQN